MGSISRIGLLFNQLRPERHVDLALHRGSLVVGPVDAPCHGDEVGPGIRPPLAVRMLSSSSQMRSLTAFELRTQRIEFAAMRAA